jgi:hypothetical protein
MVRSIECRNQAIRTSNLPRRSVSAACLDLAFRCPITTSGDEPDSRAALAERACRGAADARRGAGDDDDFRWIHGGKGSKTRAPDGPAFAAASLRESTAMNDDKDNLRRLSLSQHGCAARLLESLRSMNGENEGSGLVFEFVREIFSR